MKHPFLRDLFEELFFAERATAELQEQRKQPKCAFCVEDFNEIDANLRAAKVADNVIEIVMMHVKNMRKEGERQESNRELDRIEASKLRSKDCERRIELYISTHFEPTQY